MGEKRTRKKRPVAERFWEKVRIGGIAECWEWTRSFLSSGYGAFAINTQPQGAHRVAYELTYGEIPKGTGHHGTCVLHRCDNPRCCNPHHLFLGTHAENMRDCSSKKRKRAAAGEQHCNAKLTEKQVREIRANSNVRYVHLAVRYGVTDATIGHIRTGRTWRHLLPKSVDMDLYERTPEAEI